MWQNFKSVVGRFLSDDTVYFSLLLVVTAVAAFGLGRMTSPGAVPSQIPATPALLPASDLELTPGPAPTPILEELATEGVVASKSGTKYHFPWCPGAQQMKEENKIYFASRAEAEAAGYSKASNCKGL